MARDDGTAHTIYFQDNQQTIADYPAGTAAASPTYTYVYASYIDEPVMRGGSGGLRYYHRNQQYSIISLTDGGGSIAERYAYSAYGQVAFANAAGTPQTSSASHNRYTYTGREWNAGLKLYHYRARLYDPIGGRFVTRDPIGYSGGINTYQYQSALSSLDPKGTFSIAITPALPVLGVVDSDGAIIVDGVIACRRRNKPDGPDPCKGVCEAYLRASLAQNQPTFGGGVLCLGRHKCPCVFAYPLLGIMPKQCPALDAIIMRHEVKHLRDVTCNFPENTITRPPYANPTNATAIECRHRQASIGELSTFIETEASPFCKSKMSEIKDELESWVSLNCMGDQPFDPFS